MVFCVYLRKYAKFRKMFQTKVVDLIEIHIFCWKHFFLEVILSEKMSDFQFGRREKIGDSVEGEGVPSFIGMCSVWKV